MIQRILAASIFCLRLTTLLLCTIACQPHYFLANNGYPASYLSDLSALEIVGLVVRCINSTVHKRITVALMSALVVLCQSLVCTSCKANLDGEKKL
jgi:hypothetical protein